MAKKLSIVARRIQEVREAKGLTRQELADRLSVFARKNGRPAITYLQVYRYETGTTDVAADVAAWCAEAMDVSVASLFRESKAAS